MKTNSTRRKFLSFLGIVFTAPTTLFAATMKACQAKVEMFGELCKPVVKKCTKIIRRAASPWRYVAIFDIEGDRGALNDDIKIARHLQSVHRINPSGMTHDQMLIAHDRAHGVRVAAPTQTIASSGCPGGVCPNGVSRRRRR